MSMQIRSEVSTHELLYVRLEAPVKDTCVYQSYFSIRRCLMLSFLCVLCVACIFCRWHFKLVSLSQRARPSPVVRTACGIFIGNWQHERDRHVLAAFRGIQFGHALRWLPPKEVCPDADNVRHARADGPACLRRSGAHAGEDEDCLYLNLFAPARTLIAQSAGRKPIIVYIHGGGLDSGSATSDGPVENIASMSDAVIVVACQYRLGVLGFMALKELSSRDPRGVSGNYGFLDQQLCLRWIQRHGSSFGGDTSRVTLLGQSAGGTSILAHLVSAGLAGLFHGAIALSGSPGAPRLRQSEKEHQDEDHWLPATGCANSSDIPVCLLSLDAPSLAESLPARYGLFGTSDYPRMPGPEGHIPWRTLCHVDGVTVLGPADSTERNDVPLLLESMAAEMGATASLPGEDLELFLNHMFGSTFGKDFVDNVLDLYGNMSSPELAAYEIDGDTGNFCGLLRIGQIAASVASSPVYVGKVEAEPMNPMCWCNCSQELESPLPFHGWDLAAALDVWNRLWCSCTEYVPTPLDRLFGSLQRERWLELAVQGALSSSHGWSSLAHANSYARIKHSDLVMQELPSNRCKFWEAHNVSQNWYWVN